MGWKQETSTSGFTKCCSTNCCSLGWNVFTQVIHWFPAFTVKIDLIIRSDKEARSFCSIRAADIDQQCITHSEHCKHQLIGLAPLYYSTLSPNIIGSASASFCALLLCILHHFLLNVNVFPVLWLKWRGLRLRKREGRGEKEKEEWPSHMSCRKSAGKTRRNDRGLDSCCLATRRSSCCQMSDVNSGQSTHDEVSSSGVSSPTQWALSYSDTYALDGVLLQGTPSTSA